jgi:hypothetical protein
MLAQMTMSCSISFGNGAYFLMLNKMQNIKSWSYYYLHDQINKCKGEDHFNDIEYYKNPKYSLVIYFRDFKIAKLNAREIPT